MCNVIDCKMYENVCFFFTISDSFVVTNQETDLADVFGRLFQVSAAVSDLEGIVKDGEQSSASGASHTKD